MANEVRKPKQVSYELEEWDALPEKEPGQRGERSSALTRNIETIVEKNLVNKPLCIAKYANRSGAPSAIGTLRKRYGGNIKVQGFEFAIRRVNMEVGGQSVKGYGLFVTYDPSKVVAGAAAEDQKIRAERSARVKAARQKANQATQKAS